MQNQVNNYIYKVRPLCYTEMAKILNSFGVINMLIQGVVITKKIGRRSLYDNQMTINSLQASQPVTGGGFFSDITFSRETTRHG